MKRVKAGVMAQTIQYTAVVLKVTESDNDVIFCLQLLSKSLTCTLHLSVSGCKQFIFIIV